MIFQVQAVIKKRDPSIATTSWRVSDKILNACHRNVHFSSLFSVRRSAVKLCCIEVQCRNQIFKQNYQVVKNVSFAVQLGRSPCRIPSTMAKLKKGNLIYLHFLWKLSTRSHSQRFKVCCFQLVLWDAALVRGIFRSMSTQYSEKFGQLLICSDNSGQERQQQLGNSILN